MVNRVIVVIEASLAQIGDDELQFISVELKAVADWSKQREND